MISKEELEKIFRGEQDRPEFKILNQYMRIGKMRRMILEKHLNKTGVYRSQHQLLMHIFINPDVSQKELARIHNVSTATVAVSLKKLEKGGYIGRAGDQEDNRYNKIHITEKGLEVVEASIGLFSQVDREMFTGFSDEEREKFTKFLEAGFVDAFRHFYPVLEGAYSWGSYMCNAWKNNAGWRIDYFCVSESMKERLVLAAIHPEIFGSDHCPVEVVLNL